MNRIDRIDRIDISVAEGLIDFSRGMISGGLAHEQLRGTVAIHNIIADKGFAYLADEVGMGKTYVALGVVGLMRFFNPGMRILFIAPRDNIQTKWIKELYNFTRNNWLNQDQRVKSVQNLPVVPAIKCNNLEHWGGEIVRNPNRDAFLRMPSFSLSLSSQNDSWVGKRDRLMRLVPKVAKASFSLASKEAFKRNYARALNTILPEYDLVVIDEAHNLKHGREGTASRNQILAGVLGIDDETDLKAFPGYGGRCKRVLLLSATPLETDYAELWHQLDLFGYGQSVAELKQPEYDPAKKRELVGQFMVRRITSLQIGGKPHTKNMYRQEWRGGGCMEYDKPLEIPDERQRLIVALVQKKVSEVLNSARFNASFQIGMLSSFESFAATVKSKRKAKPDDEFDGDQTQDTAEREGIDTSNVTEIAQSYRRTFGKPLPHPKMDAVVASLKDAFRTRQKALIFVRRIKSVDELQAKLCLEYDEWIRTYIRTLLPDSLSEEFEKVWAKYQADRRPDAKPQTLGVDEERETDTTDDDEPAEPPSDDDAGGNDTFFSWFFRGDGPQGVLSGAAFRKNRLQGEGSAYTTFFEDNYLLALLGRTRDPLDALATALGREVEDARREVRSLAASAFEHRTRRKKYPRFHLFHAYQVAGLTLLANHANQFQQEAKIILNARYGQRRPYLLAQVAATFPAADEYIGEKTFFTELRERAELCKEIWLVPNRIGHNGAAHEQAMDDFRNREQRRELLASVARLGHPLITLWVLFVAQLKVMSLGKRTSDASSEVLINNFLEHLEHERQESITTKQPLHTAYSELRDVAQCFDLLLDTTFPQARREPLPGLPKLYATVLSAQAPVGGMHGGVNSKLVKQFRMPGYPIIMISTDVLQEGEDLHTFCSHIVHYGISWTSSAMEQKTGRIDRINSHTHRRLESAAGDVPKADLLQVYYPYLRDSVEVLQVERVFERMNKFLSKTHILGGDEATSKGINTDEESTRNGPIPQQIRSQLKSAFEIHDGHLSGKKKEVQSVVRRVDAVVQHLQDIRAGLDGRLRIDWEPQSDRSALYGTVYCSANATQLVEPSVQQDRQGVRRQPFALYLRSAWHSGDVILLHAISPVGKLVTDPQTLVELMPYQTALDGAKVCLVPEGVDSYSITVEGDIRFDPTTTQLEEVIDLLTRVAISADRIEREKMGKDAHFNEFGDDLTKEGRDADDGKN